MVKKAKSKRSITPKLSIKRFAKEQEAEEYADETAQAMGEKEYGVSRPKGAKGVTVLSGVKRPAVLVVTPHGKIPRRKSPRITPKRPKLPR